MPTSPPVQLIRESDALPLLETLDEVGAPVERLIQVAGLPDSFRDGGEGFIPFRRMLQFAGHAARSQDIADLCWRGVVASHPEQLGGWGSAAASAPTLRGAILAFCESFKRDAPLMEIGLDISDGDAWFWRRRPRSVLGWVGNEEGQQYAFAAMTRVVRMAAGPDWVPRRAHLESTTAPWVAALPELADCKFELGQPTVGIAVPYALLDQPLMAAETVQNGEGLDHAEPSLAGSLRQAFATLLPAADPTIEVAAEIAEVSTRNLRRRLEAEGTCWREVRDRTRLEVSLELLKDPERTIIDVASHLRYSHPAHFIRAFRRWMGESPHAWRRRQLDATAERPR